MCFTYRVGIGTTLSGLIASVPDVDFGGQTVDCLGDCDCETLVSVVLQHLVLHRDNPADVFTKKTPNAALEKLV